MKIALAQLNFTVGDIKTNTAKIVDAIKRAKELCDNKPIFVFGSLYLASQIRPLLKK